MFIIEKDNQQEKITINKLDSILINPYVGISGSVIELAITNNIDIIMIDKYGNPYGRFWSNKFGSTSKIRKNQLKICNSKLAFLIAKKFIINKLDNQILHLLEIYKKQKRENNILVKSVNKINKCREKIIKIQTINKQLVRSYEGNAGKYYYRGLSSVLPEKIEIKRRSYRPAKDEINTLLNYGFGILYSKVEKACIVAGLDPSIGFFHEDNYNKIPLVYDIIEKFRDTVYRSVYRSFTHKKVNKEWFLKKNNSFFLTKTGKDTFIKEFYKIYNAYYLYNDRQEKMKNIIQLECHKLAKIVLNAKSKKE